MEGDPDPNTIPVQPKPKNSKTKTKGQLQDDSIMGTNNSSIVSKRSVERLYFSNEPQYFRHFVKKPQRRAPLINRGYWLRMRAIDHVVRQFLDQESEKSTVVVNLGCGYDPLPWQCLSRYPKSSQGVKFIDIDYRDLMLKKRSVVRSTDHLYSAFTNIDTAEDEVLLRSDQYIQIGCDLRDLLRLQNILARVTHIEQSRFLFVAEVSITYMDIKSTDALIQWAATLPDAKFCLLEQLLPAGIDHPFATTMMAHFNKLGTPLNSVKSYPKTCDQENRFKTLGWQSSRARNLWELWGSSDFITPEERKSLDAIEPFDEWEEFALFGCHYVLLVASTDSSLHMKNGRTPDDGQESNDGIFTDEASIAPIKHFPTYFSEYPKGKGCNRFAAALTVRASNPSHELPGIFGGMGLTTRVNTMDVYVKDDQTPFVSDIDVSTSTPSARMCHTCTVLDDAGSLLVGGRASPDKALADCWLYHKWLNTWERVDDLPYPMYRHQAVALGSGFVLVAPGRINSQSVSSDYLIWHRGTGWRVCIAENMAPVLSFGSVFFCTESTSPGTRTGLLAGGITSDGVVQESVWSWNLSDLSLKEPKITFLCIKNLPPTSSLARFGASVISQNKITFVIGGITRNNIVHLDHEVISIGQDADGYRLTKLDLTLSPRPLLIGTTVAAYGRHLMLAGGSAVCFSFGTFWNKGCYTIHTSNPESLPTYQLSTENKLRSSYSYRQTLSGIPYRAHSVPKEPLTKGTELVVQSILRVRLESSERFRELRDAGKPVIIEGLDIGPCTSLWSPDYLREHVGDRQVVVHKATVADMSFVDKNFAYETKTFGDFIDEVIANQRVYLRSLSAEKPSDLPARIYDDYPTIASDFKVPRELNFVQDNMHSSPLRISNAVSMWLHYDVMANILCQVRGVKRLLLFPPSDVKYFDFEPGSSSSSANVFKNLNQYPHSHPHEAILHPGDILFIPALWLHAASPQEGMSISVNVFYRSLQSGYSTGRDVYGNRDIQAYEKGRQDIHKILKSFDGLPADVRGFYLQRLVNEFEGGAR